MIQFNLSPSAINTYRNSQLEFYFQQIVKAKPDTQTIECFGDAGNAVHEALEESEHKDIINKFNQQWDFHGLDFKNAMNNKPLSKALYMNAVLNGVNILNNFKDYDIKKEELVLFSLIDNNDFKINIKGFIDGYYSDENDALIGFDWKTSSSVDNSDNFTLQAKHYCYSLYRKFGKVPKKFMFYYVKINKVKEEMFTEQELLDYEKYLKSLADEIMQKGDDISKYDCGNYSHIFNAHKQKCDTEFKKRNTPQKEKCVFKLVLYNSKIHIQNTIPNILEKVLKKQFSYEVQGAHFIREFSNWDGIQRLYSNNKLPVGCYHRLIKILHDYGNKFDKDIQIIEIDKRNIKENIPFRDELLTKTLRPEQNDAVNTIIDKQIGIISSCTGSGKTLITAEVIRRLGLRTLFIVDTIDLLHQTANVFKTELGDEFVGVIGGGYIDTTKAVTVATFQTLSKHLIKFKDFLHSINVVIVDEVQIGASKGILKVLKSCINAHYLIGASATPWRNDGNDMLIESIVGEVVYEFSTTDAQDKGYITKSNILFYDTPIISEEYDMHDDYNINITNNDYRNDIIKYEAETSLNNNENVIILTKYIEHGKLLNELVDGSVHIYGGSNKKIRENMWKAMREGKGLCIITTNKIASKGLNVPTLDKLINAGADGNAQAAIQSLGRVLRRSEGKLVGVYIDFKDNSKYTKKWSKKRMQGLKDQGHDINIINRDL